MPDSNKGSQYFGGIRRLAKIGYTQTHLADRKHLPIPSPTLWIKSEIYLVGKYCVKVLNLWAQGLIKAPH
jgi:hypothetical protein